MSSMTPSAAAIAVRHVGRTHGGNARIAFGALLVFLVLVFTCPGTLVPELAPILPAKGVAAVMLGALGLSWLLYGRRLVVGGTIGVGLLTVLGIALCSTLWSVWPDVSLREAAELAKFVAVYFVIANVVDSPERARKVVGTIVLGSAIPALGAVKNYLLGEHLVEGNRAAWVSMFGNPDDLAYFMVVAIPLALALREVTSHRGARLALVGLVGLFGTVVFLSASRGGILTLAAVAAYWWAREIRHGRIGLWFCAALLLAVLFVPTHVWSRTSSVVSYRDDPSAMGRIWTLQAGWKMFYQRPFGGLGAGTFLLAFPSYAPLEASNAIVAHNSFMQVLAEDGMFALAAFLLALGGGFAAAWRAGQSGRKGIGPFGAGLQAAMVAFVLSSLTGGIALSWPIYWVLGLSAALSRMQGAPGAVPETASATV